MSPFRPLTLAAALLIAMTGAACDEGEGRVNYLDEADEVADPQITQGQPSEFGDEDQPGNAACPTPREAAACADERGVWAKIPNMPMCCFYGNICQVPNPEWSTYPTEDACQASIEI